MILSLLSKFVAALLVVVLACAILAQVLDHTVFNSHYLQGQLKKVDAYNRLADDVAKSVVEQTAYTNLPTAESLILAKLFITPDLLQQKIDDLLNQLETYYKSGGEPPSIRFGNIIDQLRASGLPVPADSALQENITLKVSPQLGSAVRMVERIKLWSLLAAPILVVLLLLLSWRRHKFAALPDVVIVLGLLIGVIALALSLAQGISSYYLNFGSSAYSSVAKDLLDSISRDLGMRLAIIAALLFVVGVVARILVARLAGNAVKQSTTGA